MKRITTLGLSLLAVVAFSAIASSSAFAGTYGVCAKAAKETVEWKEGAPPKEKSKKKSVYTGGYTDKNCQEVNTTDVYRNKGANPGPEGKYEWVPYPGPAGTNWKFTSTTKVATLSGPTGIITCKKSTDVGEITGLTSDVDTVTFTSCTTEGAKCNSPGEPEGTIKTNELATALEDAGDYSLTIGPAPEYKSEYVTPAEGEVWTKFESPEGFYGHLAEFECAVAAAPLHKVWITVQGESAAVNGGNVNVISKSGTTLDKEGVGEQAELANVCLAPKYGTKAECEEGAPGASLTPEGGAPSTQFAEGKTKGESKIEIKT